MFEEEFNKFLTEERKGATGRRLEMLQKDLVGEKKLFKEVLWPVFKTFDGFTLEYEMVSASGITMYIDAFYAPLQLAFESEGFVVHAENITRDRFNFERSRVRTMAKYRYTYVPFSWDELDKKAEACRSSLYELLGVLGGLNNVKLSLYEREVLRYALTLQRPLRIADVCNCLQKGVDVSRKVIGALHSQKLIMPCRNERQRHHEYVVDYNKIIHLI